MKVQLSEPFLKNYERLHPTVRKKVDRIIILLAQDIRHPGIRAKKLINTDDIWEAHVGLHTRLTFRIQGDILVFRRVGTHEIYRSP